MAVGATDLRAAGTRERILDAAFSAISTFGLSRFTMDDVARLAGLSRQSVYRYFDAKDALILALVEREEDAFLEGVRAVHRQHADLEDAMREAILYCLRAVREHPLLDRLLASEPEALLPYLTTRGGGMIARAGTVLEQLAAERPGVDLRLVHRVADLAVRAVVSYTLTPGHDRPEDVAADLAKILTSAVREEDVR